MAGNLLKAGFVAASLSLSLAAGTAFAADGAMLDKLTPENVGATLEALNIPYSLETDPRGYPMLVVNPAKFPVRQFNVMFFSCDKVAAECDDITLWAWYDLGGPVSPKAVISWNDPFKDRHWTTAYIDKDNDPALTMNINATGGIGERALQILVNTYVEDIFSFRDALKESQVSMNDAPSGGGVDDAVRGFSLVDGDVLEMTELVKEFGGEGFAHVKEVDKK